MHPVGQVGQHLRDDLNRVQRQRDQYMLAASVTGSRSLALRWLSNASRLTQEVECLCDALRSLDETGAIRVA